MLGPLQGQENEAVKGDDEKAEFLLLACAILAEW